MTGRGLSLTPSSDMRARMPPSPSLLMRMANETYLIVATMIKVQMTSESVPSITPRSGFLPVRARTVFKVYSGLVRISPKTTPNAAKLKARRLELQSDRLPVLGIMSDRDWLAHPWTIPHGQFHLTQSFQPIITSRVDHGKEIPAPRPLAAQSLLPASSWQLNQRSKTLCPPAGNSSQRLGFAIGLSWRACRRIDTHGARSPRSVHGLDDLEFSRCRPPSNGQGTVTATGKREVERRSVERG